MRLWSDTSKWLENFMYFMHNILHLTGGNTVLISVFNDFSGNIERMLWIKVCSQVTNENLIIFWKLPGKWELVKNYVW